MTTTTSNSTEQTLLTKKSLALSLTPPRVPAFESFHHAIYTNQKRIPKNWKTDYHVHDTHHVDFHYMDKLTEKLHYHKQQAQHMAHPHMFVTTPHSFTIALVRCLGIDRFNTIRDSGWFRTIMDGVLYISVPVMGLFHPRLARKFYQLTRQRTVVRYGSHPRQYIDLYVAAPYNNNNNNNNNNKSDASSSTTSHKPRKRLIIFVHGGAWGSGEPWMYRLIAVPFLNRNMDVAIPGYRTYPCGTASCQIDDLSQAIAVLSDRYDTLTLIGHSSGAHIGLLYLVRQQQQKQLHSKIDSFIGLSGPYDIDDHFHYEAARGVEELSPMKAANGHTKESFRYHSPCHSLQKVVAQTIQEHHISDQFPKLVFIHGVEDDTVPFTASAEAARQMRACGITFVKEEYLGETNHTDVILQVMLGGRAQDATIEWIKKFNDQANDEPSIQRPVLSVQSKL